MSPLNNARALVIGVSNYHHVNRLPLTVLKDAQDIYDILTDPDYGGYRKDSVQLLLDGNATQTAIRNALADLAKRSNQDSVVFIYISSHGGHIEHGPDAGDYLLPVNVFAQLNEPVASTAISDDEFSKALRLIPARKITVVFDCCHSGGIGIPKTPTALMMKDGLRDGYYEALQAGRGCAILASSRSSEVSSILGNSENSLFTQHLLAGIKGGIPSEDGMIRVFDLFEYLQPRVTKDRSDQHPVFKANLEENYPIALYLGGQKGNIGEGKQGYRYDAYVSCVDKEPDASWVWETLIPRLASAGLVAAISNDSSDPGVPRLVSMERGITQSRRTVLVLSPNYLADKMAEFENTMAQTLGAEEGAYRVVPVKITSLDSAQLPLRIRTLGSLDLYSPQRVERDFDRLLRALKDPLPKP